MAKKPNVPRYPDQITMNVGIFTNVKIILHATNAEQAGIAAIGEVRDKVPFDHINVVDVERIEPPRKLEPPPKVDKFHLPLCDQMEGVADGIYQTV